ncbi:hypothetical protein N658DRAFT_451700 [Parathielavia hyrcaniae]|uniref:Flavin reductase like domain-containing protein n=1 Tax=Parathielavia hyrcaniae TaxID=113614 RepID=A0AAN6Q357_9PEZI|nr:hypothetical protein N658DRAFT_451700 [Parathielavia hyrcaniae]
MSSCRVLVGLAAERAPLSSVVFRRGHGSSGPAGAVKRFLTVAAQPQPPSNSVSPRRANTNEPSCRTTPPFRRPIHTTTRASQHHRRPRTFHLTDPQPPTIHPPSSSPSSLTGTTTEPTLPEQFRTIMRLLTHSVVVCTATHPSPSLPPSPSPSHPAVPRAMTMSSFTSLALRPTPVVSFNVAAPSRTLDAVAASGRFNIHVLADDGAGARVADWFAGGNAEGREVFERLVRAGGVKRVGFMPAAGYCSGSVGEGEEQEEEGLLLDEAPVLEGGGVLYVLKCRLLEDEPSRGLVKVRDHFIVLGEVVEIVEGSGAKGEAEERFGLLYADRRYRQLGDCITPGEREADGVIDQE